MTKKGIITVLTTWTLFISLVGIILVIYASSVPKTPYAATRNFEGNRFGIMLIDDDYKFYEVNENQVELYNFAYGTDHMQHYVITKGIFGWECKRHSCTKKYHGSNDIYCNKFGYELVYGRAN